MSIGEIIETVAGNGSMVPSGDGGDARQAGLGSPFDVEAAPDGSIYIVSFYCTNGTVWPSCDSNYSAVGRVVRRIKPDGVIETVSGLHSVGDIEFGPGGDLYFLTSSLNDDSPTSSTKLVRVHRDGTQEVVAGKDNVDLLHEYDDNIPAKQARFQAGDLEIGPDGVIYLGSSYGLLRVGLDGVMHRVTRQPCSPMTLGKDGVIYGGQHLHIGGIWAHKLVRVDPSGYVEQIGGGSVTGSLDDGAAIGETRLGFIQSLEIDQDGALLILSYITTPADRRIRKVLPDGSVQTVAGSLAGEVLPVDGAPAKRTSLANVSRISVGPDGSIYAVQGNGRVRRLQDPLPRYSGDEIIIPDGDGSIAHVFSPEGLHLRTYSTLLNVDLYRFEYEGGLLARVIDANAEVTRIERTGETPTAILSPDGWTTTLGQGGNGWLDSIAVPSGDHYALGYEDGDGLLTSFATVGVGASTFIYDAEGRLVRDTNASAGYQLLDHVEEGDTKTTTVTTREGLQTTYVHRDLPDGTKVRSTTDPAGQTVEVRAHNDGTREVFHPDGTHVTYESAPDPRFGMLVPLPKRLTVTLPDGSSITTTYERTVTLSDPADPLSVTRIVETATTDGRQASTTVDLVARTMTSTSPEGRTISSRFDALGQVVEISIPGYLPIEYRYENGRLVEAASGTGPDRRAIAIAYGPRGLVDAVTATGRGTTSFVRDFLTGRVTEVWRANDTIARFGLADLGLTSTVSPPERGLYASHVDLLNRTVTSTLPPAPGAGTSARLTFDYDGRFASAEGLASEVAFPEYLANGRLQAMNTPRGRTTFTYDPVLGRLQSIRSPEGELMETLRAGGRVAGLRWSGTINGAVSVEFAPDHRIASLLVNGGAPVALEYDLDGYPTKVGAADLTRDPANGALVSERIGTVLTTRGENGFGELATLATERAGVPLHGETILQRDLAGRITRRQEQTGGESHIYDYGYDAIGRLVDVSIDGLPSGHYEYDANGARISRSAGDGARTGTYDGQDRVLSWGGWTYTNRLGGELESKTDTATAATTSYRYTDGALSQVVLPDGTVIDYVLDAGGTRIGRMRDGVLERGWLYDGNRVVAELDGNSAVRSRFVYAMHAHVPSYMVRDGQTYVFVRDRLGSVRLVVAESSGTIMQRLEYDEFGRVLVNTNPGFQPFGYVGGLTDDDTGLVHFGARDYDAELGRWLTRDPLGFGGGDLNLYAYVLNDPINGIDPLGTSWYDPTEWTLEDVSNFAANFGDTLTLGATESLREALGVNDVVDPCSRAYAAGGLAAAGLDLGLGVAGFARNYRAARGLGGVRLRVGRPVEPMEKTLDMALSPEVYAQAVVRRYRINLRGSGETIALKFNPNLVAAGKSRQAAPTVIEFGPAALRSEEELANTIAHELNHARSWLRGGSAPEDAAYAAGDALAAFIRGAL